MVKQSFNCVSYKLIMYSDTCAVFVLPSCSETICGDLMWINIECLYRRQ